MARRLYLHIGTMKAATTYLQQLFDANVDLLAGHGILWQGSRFDQDAIHEFQDTGMMNPAQAGAWSRFQDQIKRTSGDVLVSMELLAKMRPQRAAELRAALEADEVVVILTARDLSRVAPSHWQETTQNMGTTPWADWIEEICSADPATATGDAAHFWRHHYLPSIIEAWSPLASRTYLVTIPQGGGDSGAVWRRFAEIVGVPAEDVTQPTFNNASLGAHSAELMRRLNVALGDIPFTEYRRGFKAGLAKQKLSRRAGQEPRPGLTAAQHGRLRDVALEMVGELQESDVTVVGDLQDLVPPVEPQGEPYDPGQATDKELLDAAMVGLLGLGRRVNRVTNQRDELQRRLNGPSMLRSAASGAGNDGQVTDAVRRRLGRVKRTVMRQG